MKKHIIAEYSAISSQDFPKPTIVSVYGEIRSGPINVIDRTVKIDLSVNETKKLRDILTIILDRENKT